MAKKASTKSNTIPADETPAQRFIRLAEYRVGRAVRDIQTIANLTGSSYESTPAQHTAIMAALNTACQDVADALKSGGKKAAGGFKLS
jgi:hypothetical protein